MSLVDDPFCIPRLFVFGKSGQQPGVIMYKLFPLLPDSNWNVLSTMLLCDFVPVSRLESFFRG